MYGSDFGHSVRGYFVKIRERIWEFRMTCLEAQKRNENGDLKEEQKKKLLTVRSS